MLPSGPGSAPMTAPHFMPAGSCAQFASRRYGFGRSLIAFVVFHFGDGAWTAAMARAPSAMKRARRILLRQCRDDRLRFADQDGGRRRRRVLLDLVDELLERLEGIGCLARRQLALR